MAELLRALADQIEEGMAAEVDGHRVRLGARLRATVEVPDDPEEQATVVDVRLTHPSRRRWDITRLRDVLSHPGD